MSAVVSLSELHPELIAARRNVALASDKLRALQDEALRLSLFVIPLPDRVDALIDIARANGLFDKFRSDDIEHVIGQGSRGIPTLTRISNATPNNSRDVRSDDRRRQGPFRPNHFVRGSEIDQQNEGSFGQLCREADRKRGDLAKGAIPPKDKEQTGKRLMAHNAADITPVPVKWIWPGRLAVGKTTLVGGDPGVGKSLFSLYAAATISQGSAWPCKEGRAPKRSIIIFCAEDGLGDTIVPRLIAAGADLKKVKIVTAVTEEDGNGRRIFNLSRDLDLLEAEISEVGDVGLVIIDPVDAYIGGGVDSHKNAAMRAVLEPISELADRMQTAILALTHFSKQIGTAKAMYRFIGSIAHVASARVAFAAVADNEDKGRTLLLHVKNNLASPKSGLAFRVKQRLIVEGVTGSAIHFEPDYVTNTAAEALAAEIGSDEVTSKDDAIGLLREVLAGGPVKVAEIEREARAACLLKEGQSISQSKPFRSARTALGVVTYKAGMGKGWVWELPKMPSGSEDAL